MTCTATFITAQAKRTTSMITLLSVVVFGFRLFSAPRTIRKSQRKTSATRSPTRRRSASKVASIAFARTSCQRGACFCKAGDVWLISVRRLNHEPPNRKSIALHALLFQHGNARLRAIDGTALNPASRSHFSDIRRPRRGRAYRFLALLPNENDFFRVRGQQNGSRLFKCPASKCLKDQWPSAAGNSAVSRWLSSPSRRLSSCFSPWG